MIIKDRKEQGVYWDKIIACDSPLMFNINEDGQLSLSNSWTSDLFLAFFRGQWYASGGEEKGGSENRFMGNHQLFAYGNGYYYEYKGVIGAEVAGKDMSLTNNTQSFLLYYHDNTIQLLIVDGNKSKNIASMAVPATHESWKLLVIIMCALIERYNADAAKEIREFWNYDVKKPVFDRYKKKTEIKW